MANEPIIDDGVEIVSMSDMSEEERLIAEEHAKLYQPNNQTIIDTNQIFNYTKPIDPMLFSKEALNYLQSKNVVISNNLNIVIKELCLVFNACIDGQNQHAITTSLVYPAQTGVGKSLCLQLYVSMLEKHSSLIVVPTVETAIKYCEVINELSGNENYARTTYAITDKNQKNDLRVEPYKLREYRAVVVTHSMFKKLNQKVNIDIYKLYKKNQRDLIVVDEKITMFEQHKITYQEFDNLQKNLETIFHSSKDALSIDPQKETLSFLKTIKEHLDEREKEIVTDPKALLYTGFNEDEPMPTDSNDPRFTRASCPVVAIRIEELQELMKANKLDIEKSNSMIKEVLTLRIDELFSEIKDIGGVDNPAYKEQVVNRSLEPVNALEVLMKDWFLLHKSNYGNVIFVVSDILNRLGKNVVLDATAVVNEFYKVANRAFGYIGLYKATQIRKYENLTIYKAKGYKQTRHELYKKDSKHTENNAIAYASYASSVLTADSDKLLIICQKTFRSHLERYCSDTRIRITHWGDHVGKNDWSDCNKVMVVGWNYLNPLENISQIYSAAREIDLVSMYLSDDIIDTFRATQIADDLVQAVMRSQARIIATSESDCKPTDVYLFYYDDSISNQVLDIFETQFPKATIKQWKPQGKPIAKKKTAVEKRADIIIELLKEKLKTNTTYLLSDVKKDTGIVGANMSRVLSDGNNYLNQELKKCGYEMKKKDGKSIVFVLE